MLRSAIFLFFASSLARIKSSCACFIRPGARLNLLPCRLYALPAIVMPYPIPINAALILLSMAFVTNWTPSFLFHDRPLSENIDRFSLPRASIILLVVYPYLITDKTSIAVFASSILPSRTAVIINSDTNARI